MTKGTPASSQIIFLEQKVEEQSARVAELDAELDEAKKATRDWLSATADEKLLNRRLCKRVSDLIREGMMLIGKVEQRDARIEQLKAALKPFSDASKRCDGKDEQEFMWGLKIGDLLAARAAMEGKDG